MRVRSFFILLLMPAVGFAAPRWRIDVVEGHHLEPGDIAIRSDGEAVAAWGGAAVEVATRSGGAWTVETVTGEDGSYWHVSLALDSTDRPLVAWHDHHAGSLHFARFDGSTWTEETVDDSGVVGEWASLALDPEGRPWIAYRDHTNQSLKLARHDGAAWSIETLVDSGDTGTWASLGIDGSGLAYLAYRDEASRSLELGRFDGGAWSFETVDAGVGDAGRHAGLAISDGRPVISYQRAHGDQLTVARDLGGFWVSEVLGSGAVGAGIAAAGTEIHVAAPLRSHWVHDGAAWTSMQMDQRAGDFLGGLTLDAAGRPWVLGFGARDGQPDLNSFQGGTIAVSWRDDSGTWIYELIREGDPFRWGGNLALALDSDDQPALFHTRISASMSNFAAPGFLSRRVGETWVTEPTLPADISPIWFRFAIDSQDRPALARGATQREYFARDDGTGWMEDEVARTGGCCAPGLAFDADDSPLLSAFDGASLELLRWDGLDWASEVVDDAAGGRSSSVALLSDGRPALSYRAGGWAWGHAEWDGATWVRTLIDSTSSSGFSAQIAIGPGDRRWSVAELPLDSLPPGLPNRVSCAWSDDGVNWTSEVIDVVTGGRDLSLTLDPTGQPAVAYEQNETLVVARRAADGSWSRSELDAAGFNSPTTLVADAEGGLHLGHARHQTARVAYLPPPARLHRGLVSDLSLPWRAAALPLDASNDDETAPFPVSAELGGTFVDEATLAGPLVLYRVLAETGSPLTSSVLRVTKLPGSTALRLSY